MENLEISDEREYARARERLTRHLAVRDHSASELKTKLERHHPATLVARVVADATADGLLASDEQVARRKLDGFERKLKSRRYIEQQLRARGLPVPAAGPDDDAREVMKARELVAAKFGDPVQLALEDRGRAFRFLKYRGFADRHIRRVFEDAE